MVKNLVTTTISLKKELSYYLLEKKKCVSMCVNVISKIKMKSYLLILYLDAGFCFRYLTGFVIQKKKVGKTYFFLILEKKTKTFVKFYLNNPNVLLIKLITKK